MTTQGTETRSAETTGSARKGDGPVAESDAPDRPDTTDYRNRAERAEAECNELRERLDLWRAALALYASPCDATETTPCTYEGNLCCMTARNALQGESNGQ